MSELKVFYSPDGEHTKSYYLKSEADKVIAELKDKLKVQTSSAEEAWKLKDSYHASYAEAVKELYAKNKEIAELKKQVHDSAQGLYVMQARADNEARHHKYKRCLAMAKWCASRSASWCLDPADDELHKSDFYDKWKLRWLELAEKFKEEK